MIRAILGVVTLLALSVGVSAKCLNEQGEARSWFVMLKMPDGYEYLYADNVDSQLRKGTSLLTDQGNPVGRVLEPIYSEEQDDTNFLVYNDEVPDGATTSTRGHTKGAVIWRGDNTVQWLIHSVPNFPPQQEKGYSYPDTARRYGQSILCVDMRESDLDLIVQHLYFTWPLIYNSSVSAKYKDNVPYLSQVLQGKHVKHSDSWVKVQQFDTAERDTKFTAFAKSGEYGADLYKDLIAAHFQDNLHTETWQNGRGRVPSNCTGNTAVYNNKNMKLLGREYSESQDHSKWAVSEQGLLCVGGINRMSSQYSRGGGSFCFRAGTLWKQIRDGIQDWEPCQELFV